MSAEDRDQTSVLDIFRIEAETQTHLLTSSLLALERDRTAAAQLEACMRAAHSLKGAARIVGLTAGVNLAHAMEDCFVAAQEGRTTLFPTEIDLLLEATDLLSRIANTPATDLAQWDDQNKAGVDECLAALARILDESLALPPAGQPTGPPATRRRSDDLGEESEEASNRVLRVTAENLNRLIGLAGETLVESRWVKPFAESLSRLKRLQQESGRMFDSLRDTLSKRGLDEQVQTLLADGQRLVLDCQQLLAQRVVELELFDHRSTNLSNQLYDEALMCRMRPFADGIQGYPRMVRDIARALGKQVRLEIAGDATQVDRDILVKLDAPLGHLLRNAIDHGLETPDERRSAGKPEEGVVHLEARHRAGALHVTVSDDGRGIDLDQLRNTIVERNLVRSRSAAALSETELLEFLFLPGFSMKGAVTDISGRGVGLDVVQDIVRQVRGTVRVSSQPGQGTRFHLQLPVTLSVVRTLLAEIGGEPYAFPLANIIRMHKLPKDEIELLEGRQHFGFDGRRIGLVAGHQVLETRDPTLVGDELSVIVIGGAGHAYGLVVDRFLGERELVVQPLDAQLGKIRDIAAGALMPDGSPVLIVDTEDLIRSMDKLVADGRLSWVQRAPRDTGKKRKRVLVVDDSLTVREVERKLLGSRGYEVEVAVDGMDGWNALRTGHFDLVVTDIDMPRMDGIELVALINKDPNLRSVPVMVVSYKDRDEDRRRGLDAGASCYLTKGSFHDDRLVQAVIDLIGEADA